jgi:hypothetical protein
VGESAMAVDPLFTVVSGLVGDGAIVPVSISCVRDVHGGNREAV